MASGGTRPRRTLLPRENVEQSHYVPPITNLSTQDMTGALRIEAQGLRWDQIEALASEPRSDSGSASLWRGRDLNGLPSAGSANCSGAARLAR